LAVKTKSEKKERRREKTREGGQTIGFAERRASLPRRVDIVDYLPAGRDQRTAKVELLVIVQLLEELTPPTTIKIPK